MRSFTLTVDDQHACTPACEQYQCMSRAWCLTYARELITADETAATLVDGDITGMDQLVGLGPDTPGTLRLLLCTIDPDRAARVDLDDPVYVVRIHDDDGQPASLLPIDGWHRIYQARTQGRTHLPTYLFTDETERACRIRL